MTMFLKPAEGRTVLNPDNGMRPLLPEGEVVPSSIYWQHRLRDGAVVEASPSVKQPAPKADKSKA